MLVCILKVKNYLVTNKCNHKWRKLTYCMESLHVIITCVHYLSTCWISSSICSVGPRSLSHTCASSHLNSNQLEGRKSFKEVAWSWPSCCPLSLWCTIVVINVDCVGSDDPIRNTGGWPLYQQSEATDISHYDPSWSATRNCRKKSSYQL